MPALDFALVGAASGWWPASLGDCEPEPLAVGLAFGLDFAPDEPGVAEADPLPVGVAAGVGAALGAYLPQPTAWAGATRPRKFSTAAAPSLVTSVRVPPGIDTTSWSSPWMTTVASVTPVPLTRSSMICLACSMAEVDGVLPCGAFAWKITCWPPTRSRPSFGVWRSPGRKTSR